MPTLSDPTAIPERSYEEMANAAQAAIDEQNRAVEQRKTEFERLQQAVIPNRVFLRCWGIAPKIDVSRYLLACSAG